MPSNFHNYLPAYGALAVEALSSAALEHTEGVLSPSLGQPMSAALSTLGACVFSLPLYLLRHLLVRIYFEPAITSANMLSAGGRFYSSHAYPNLPCCAPLSGLCAVVLQPSSNRQHEHCDHVPSVHCLILRDHFCFSNCAWIPRIWACSQAYRLPDFWHAVIRYGPPARIHAIHLPCQPQGCIQGSPSHLQAQVPTTRLQVVSCAPT